ncbi:MAG: glycosyltransferase family 2 protein [Alphaproteobacteria bacterium GM202ARS2]|nr:glycosyltransferase family 2 protein [Alphaproteobacteria bacterium GM202ARS2]
MTQAVSPSSLPKVTVILPTYNRASYLEQAVNSILSQTLTNWELIIVDDASTDNTPRIVSVLTQRDSRIHAYRHDRNHGVATARNTALKNARGTYAAFQDDDDISHPERLHKQTTYLDSHPHTAMLSTGAVHFHGTTPPSLSVFHTQQEKLDIFPSSMGPLAHYQKVAFHPFYVTAEDKDFSLRVVEQWTHKHAATYRLAEGLYAVRSRKQDKRPGLATLPQHVLYDPWVTIAAAHRKHGLKDPTAKAKTIRDAISAIDPQFRTIQRCPSLAKTVTDLIDTCIVQALDENSILKTHAEHLAEKCFGTLSDYLSRHTVSHAIIKSHLHQSIRHHKRATYLATLHNIQQLSPDSLRVLAPRLLFACLRRRRFSFILPYLTALLRPKPPPKP